MSEQGLESWTEGLSARERVREIATTLTQPRSVEWVRENAQISSWQTALHDALSAESAEEAIITAVNRGGDTDTIGAIVGTVAGARFGASALPRQWIFVFDESDRLADISDHLVTIV